MLAHRMFHLIGQYVKPLELNLKNNLSAIFFCVGARHISINNSRLYKIFVENENKYAYKALQSSGHIKLPSLKEVPISLTDDLEVYIQRDWSKMSPQDLCESFGILSKYCSLKNMCISNKIFDSLIDHLTDNVQYMTDEQLETMFHYLKMWPETESVKTRNFIEVWAALDDACLARYLQWPTDKRLLFAMLTFQLNICRVCDYTTKCIQKLIARSNSLTPSEMLQVCFFLSVLRSRPLDKHNMELYLHKNFSSYTISDLAVMSMGFFKTKSPIRNKELLNDIIDKIIAKKAEIDDVSFAALLKLVRYSHRMEVREKIDSLLMALESEITRMSVMACVHVALLCSSTLTQNKSILDSVASRVASNMGVTRVKDLERLILTFATLNYEPASVDFVRRALEELRKPERQREMEIYGRSYASCIYYATILNYFPHDLIDRFLDPKFIENTYGNYHGKIGREILCLENTVEIHCPDYTGNRLPQKLQVLLSKQYTDYVPREDFKCQYNVSEKVMLDVISALRTLCGGKEFIGGDHAVPHYQRGDIFICQDKDGKFVDVSTHFPIHPFGLVKRAPTDDNWIAFVIAGRNAVLRNTGDLTGPFVAKCRDLKKIGYHPAVISGCDWGWLRCTENKLEYLEKLIKDALKT